MEWADRWDRSFGLMGILRLWGLVPSSINIAMRNRIGILSCVLLPFLGCGGLEAQDTPEIFEAEIVIYGDAAVGVTAAVQAAKMGKSALLVSQYGHLGGMTSSGLGWTDIGNSKILGGLSREFYHQAYLHYQKPEAWVQQSKDLFPKKGQGAPTFDDATGLASVFEPKVAEMIFDKWIAGAGVRVVKGRLKLEKGAEMDGERITGIHLEGGQLIKGKMFIDASYEGDLLAAAGVKFVVGREANSHYQEVSNAITKPVHGNNLRSGIDPYRVPGDAASGLLPGVNQFDEAEIGAADHRLQAFCYRMCLTDVPGNRVKISKPKDYKEEDYEILFRSIAAGQKSHFFKLSPMPNRKTDSNNIGGISTDFIGMNYSSLAPDHLDYWDWTTLSHKEREVLAGRHREWQLGLVWSLQNHPRVPEGMRKQNARWGLPKDEFVDNNHWPYNLYVREGRRMVSDFVMTEHQCRQNPKYPAVEDSVGMGAYTMDSHNVQRVVYKGNLKNEGDIQRSLSGKPYPISYKSIVPAKGECENILVPWCLSSSHIAFGSIRMEPVGMVLGQSSATAAAIAIDDKVSVQEVDYKKLKVRLIQDGQKL